MLTTKEKIDHLVSRRKQLKKDRKILVDTDGARHEIICLDLAIKICNDELYYLRKAEKDGSKPKGIMYWG